MPRRCQGARVHQPADSWVPTARVTSLGSRYALLAPVGSGTVAQVWWALDRLTGDEVAAKVVHPWHLGDPAVLTGLVQEHVLLQRLRSPRVVGVRDLVVDGQRVALVVDLVRGGDLRGVLAAQGTLLPAEAVRVVAAVLEGLAHAHALGVLHRDVTPANVLVDGAQVLLADFGLGGLVGSVAGGLGTPEHVAPEVVAGEPPTAASDVYGAGTLLYALLAGRSPFAGGSDGAAVAERQRTAVPPELDLPAALREVLDGLLAKDPTRRPSASTAACALDALVPLLLALPALPVQPTPGRWASATACGTDPSATHLHAARSRAAAPSATAGPVAPAGLPVDPTATCLSRFVVPAVPAAAARRARFPRRGGRR